MTICPSALKFVFKKSLLLWAPFIMVLAWFYGHIPINRGNRQSAINSLIEAGKKIAKYKRSVYISLSIY